MTDMGFRDFYGPKHPRTFKEDDEDGLAFRREVTEDSRREEIFGTPASGTVKSFSRP